MIATAHAFANQLVVVGSGSVLGTFIVACILERRAHVKRNRHRKPPRTIRL